MKFYLNLKEFFKTYKLAILSGVLAGCSFIPFPFFSLFFCFVPLWFFIYKQNLLKRVLVACFITQFILTAVGFNWMIYTFHFFGGMNWFVSFILLLLFCALANIYILIAGGLWFFIVKTSSLSSTPAKLILFPLLFSVFHSLTPTLFSWNMGYPWFWGALWGAQTAELWGFRFLSSLGYIFNLLFLIVYHHLYKTNPLNKTLEEKSQALKKFNIFFSSLFSFRLDKTGVKALIGVAFLFLFLNALGLYLKKRLPEPDKSLNAILIQHNVSSKGQDPKPFKNLKQKTFYSLRNLTYRSLKKARKDNLKSEDIDFIVWPEGAYPSVINKKQTRAIGFSKAIKALKIPLITGAITKEGDKYSNSLVVFDREGNIVKPIYDKIKLVIFGEYFPFIDKWSFLKKMFPYFGSNLTAGKGIQNQQLEDIQIGSQICYEALFDNLSRESANKGAQIILNVTNDSWYGSWQEPYQHLAMSLSRALEIRRPVIRSTNTGFSGVAHVNGTVEPRSPLNKAWFGFYQVPYYKNPPKTLFMSWGYYINEIFLSLLALFIFVLSRFPLNNKLFSF